MRNMAPNRGRGNRFSLSILVILACCSTACRDGGAERGSDGPDFDAATDVEQIRALLIEQQNDWNAGDIRGFMEGYLKSDSLRFASGGAYRYGWQATLERYLTTYPDRDAMGQLTFSDLDIDVLSPDWALAFGAWNLVRGGAYEDIGGLFTLVLVRTDDGWRIKFDHTSSRL